MPQTILGIDIGSYSIKVCEIKRSLKDFELTHFSEQSITQNPRLSYEESVASAIKGIIEKNDLSTEVVSVGLPSQHLSCRVIELPFTNIKKIDQALEFELEGYLPVPLEDLVVDYHILSAEQNKSRILTVYIPHDRLNKYLDMLKMAEIDPRSIGVDAVDLSLISQVAMLPQEATYAIIDIGYQKTNVCVMEGTESQGQKLLYVRTISLGGFHFTRAIQRAYHLNYEKAEALKLDRARVSNKEEKLDQISRLCQEVASELIVAIRQTYLGFKQIYANKEWGAIFLTGGGSRIGGLTDAISSALRLHVDHLDCLTTLTHQLAQPELYQDVLAPALSQTLKMIFSNKAVKINFRQGEFALKRDIKAMGGEIKQLVFWGVVILLLGLGHFVFSYFSLNSRINKANEGAIKIALNTLPELDEDVKKAGDLLDEVKTKKAEIEKEVNALTSGSDKVTPLTLLLEVSRWLPPKEEVTLDVDKFMIQEGQVTLEGITSSHEAVDTIEGGLLKSPLFKKVERQKEEDYRQAVRFTFIIMVVDNTTKDVEKPEGGT